MGKRIKANKKRKIRNFKPLTIEQIWDIFKGRILFYRDSDEEKYPEFDWCDLEGKIIANTRRISNPMAYNSLVETGNPLYFQVLEFSDNTILLFDAYRPNNEDVAVYADAYYFDRKNVSFSDDLFY